MGEPLNAVIEQMVAAGIPGLGRLDLIVDGKIHRFKPDGERKDHAWYVLFEFITDKQESLITGAFGSWKLDFKMTVSPAGASLSRAERHRLQAEQVEKAEAAKAEKAKLSAETAQRACRIWGSLMLNGKSEYLEAKKIPKVGVRFGAGGRFAVPMRNADGELVNLQFIGSDNKRFLTGGQVSGCFHTLGKIKPEHPLIVCEGYATAATLHKALDWPVIVAFNAHNLESVALILRKRRPSQQIVIAADMDIWTKGNPGHTRAQMAARRACAVVVLPEFKQPQDKTDFNDLYLDEGLEVVAEQVNAALVAMPDWRDHLACTKDGKVSATIANVFEILMHDTVWRGVLAYCEFSNRIVKRIRPPYGGKPGEWLDADTAQLRIWLSPRYGISVRKNDVQDAVLVASKKNAFHPVREYLEGLEWDGIERVDYWLSLYLNADGDDYQRAVGKKFLIGAVARVMEPPVKMDNVLILESLQGVRKSTVLSILAGKDWFSDTYFAIGNKDGYQQMQGVWIYELAELDSFNKVESTRAKQFFGSESDRYRVSYGYRAEPFPRQGVFVGTTNNDSYLKDPTGNRRYWPVKCGDVDIEALARARDQLWAEALHLYRQGVQWWPSAEEKPIFEEQQEARYNGDAWESLIGEWVNSPEQRASNLFTAADIMEGALKMQAVHMKPREQQRIGMIMHRLGWTKTRVRRKDEPGNYDRIYKYKRPWEDQLKPDCESEDPF